MKDTLRWWFIVRIHRTDTEMDYESASQRSLSTSPNLVLCYVRMFLLPNPMDHDGVMDPNPGLLKNGA